MGKRNRYNNNRYNYHRKYYKNQKQASGDTSGCLVAMLKTLIALFFAMVNGVLWAFQRVIRLFDKSNKRNQSDNTTNMSGFDSRPIVTFESSTAKVESTSATGKYASKQMLSQCEVNYMSVIKEVLNEINPDYILTPQVNLTSIIQRKTKYANELFRNVDFGVFDNNYNVVVLIEINDKTHNLQERRERDSKVKTILAEANVPLITFWTKYGINKDYIKEKLSEYCSPKI